MEMRFKKYFAKNILRQLYVREPNFKEKIWVP